MTTTTTPASDTGPPDAAAAPAPRRATAAALVCLAPVVLLTLWKAYAAPRPWWSAWYDPEVLQFYSCVDLAEGRPPSHIHTPSTVQHAIGSVIVRFTGTSPFDLPGFLAAAYAAALALTVAGVAAFARTALRGASPAVCAAAVLTLFACPQALQTTTVWGPEILVPAAGCLALAAVHAWLASPDSLRRLALAGAVAGACCGVRFTFLPWVAALGLVAALLPGPPARRAGRAALVALAAAAGFLFATFPARERYGDMLAWLWALASRTGTYGTGDTGVPGAGELVRVLAGRIASATVWHAWLAVVLAAAGVAAWRGRTDAASRRVALFCALAIVAAYLQSAKSGVQRYLLPTGVLSAGLAAFAGRALSAGGRPWVARALAAGAALAFLHQTRIDVLDHLETRRRAATAPAEFEAAVARHAGADARPVIVYGRPSETPVLVLFGDASTQAQRDAVLARHPRSGVVWGPDVHLPPGIADWDFAYLNSHVAEEYLRAGTATPVLRADGTPEVVDGMRLVRRAGR